jgi:hypothetical protein
MGLLAAMRDEAARSVRTAAPAGGSWKSRAAALWRNLQSPRDES